MGGSNLFLLCLIIAAVASEPVRHIYSGPDGCTLETCHCIRSKTRSKDDGQGYTVNTVCERNKLSPILHEAIDNFTGFVTNSVEKIAEITSYVVSALQDHWIRCSLMWNRIVSIFQEVFLDESLELKFENEADNDDGIVGSGGEKIPKRRKIFPSKATYYNRIWSGIRATAAVTRGLGEFNLRIHNAICIPKLGNILISSIGISTMMAVLHTGSLEETEGTIRTVMEFPENNLELILGYHGLLTSIENANSPVVRLKMVTKLILNEHLHLSPIYRETLLEYFHVHPHSMNLSQSFRAVAYINHLLATESENYIQKVIPPRSLSGTEDMVLVNTLYFKDSWATPFPMENTRSMVFYTTPTTYVKTNMMNVLGYFYAGEIKELEAIAVSLPYKSGRFQMIILLPFKKNVLSDLEEKLEGYPLEKVAKSMSYRKLNVYMPQLRMESNLDLELPLSEIGLECIFSENANFSDMCSGHDPIGFSVSKAIQKVVLELTEKGTGPITGDKPDLAPEYFFHGQSSTGNNQNLVFLGQPFFLYLYDSYLSIPIIQASVRNPNLIIASEAIPSDNCILD